MKSRRFLRAYAIAAVAFLSLDACWLSLAGERLYRPAIGHLMRADFDPLAALIFYALYIVGVVAFAVAPAQRACGALWRGALLGLISYSTYDLTNQATLLHWPWTLTLIDLAWGTFATGIAAVLARRLTPRH